MKVRWKLVAILLVPLAALALLGYVGVRDRQDTVDQADRVGEVVTLAARAGRVVDAIEAEAITSAAYLGSGEAGEADAVKTARTSTDRNVADLLAAGPVGVDPGRWEEATRALESLEVIRRGVDDGEDPTLDSLTTYTATITKVREVVNQDIPADSLVATTLRAYVALGETKQLAAVQLALLSASGHGMTLELPQLVGLRDAANDANVAEQVFESLAPASAKQEFRRTVAGSQFAVLDAVREAVLAGDSARLATLSEPEMFNAQAVMLSYRSVEGSMETSMLALSNDRADIASADARSFLYLVLAIAAFALLSASVMGRAISGPLNRLTRAARRVADEQLPALVETLKSPTATGATPELAPVMTRAGRDEIGDLARAFEAIQRTAVDVAVEQASLLRKGIGELFVNLARRNQSLLDRQIGFLDELEASETDPDALEQLFKLDHLATRMRRNAESLLVLAGVDTPRRWGRPVPLVDVVRAAVGEVEQYARVVLGELPGVQVQGALAADVAHVLAELLDNATQFSPPSSTVTVTGRGSAGGVRLEIADEGIGMTDEQLEEANLVLSQPPLNGLTLSRSLGFIVVGRLAERHGVTVNLGRSPLGVGVVVNIEVPHAVLVVAAEAPTAPARVEPAATPRALNPAPPEGLDDDALFAQLTESIEAMPSSFPDEVPGELVEPPALGLPAPVDEPSAPHQLNGRDHHEHGRGVGRPDDVPVDLWARLVGQSAPQWDEPEPITNGHRPGPVEWPPSAEGLGTELSPATTLVEAVGTIGELAAEIETLAIGAAAEAATTVEPITDEPAEPAAPALPATTASGLPRRRSTRSASVAGMSASRSPDGDGAVASQRSPEEIRALLSNYRSGLARGRVTPAPSTETTSDRGATT